MKERSNTKRLSFWANALATASAPCHLTPQCRRLRHSRPFAVRSPSAMNLHPSGPIGHSMERATRALRSLSKASQTHRARGGERRDLTRHLLVFEVHHEATSAPFLHRLHGGSYVGLRRELLDHHSIPRKVGEPFGGLPFQMEGLNPEAVWVLGLPIKVGLRVKVRSGGGLGVRALRAS